MNPQFETFQKFSKDGVEAMLKSFGTVSKGSQAIAVEAADFAKRQLEQSTAAIEKLAGARSLETAIEIQTDYVKGAYESLVAQSAKMGELYANLARDTFKPVEGMVSQYPAPAPFQTAA